MDQEVFKGFELVSKQIADLQNASNASLSGGTQLSFALAQLLRELENTGTLDRNATDRVRQCVREPDFLLRG